MKLQVVHAGMFKLDGGAMFGVVPQQLWHRLNTPDENNMCSWATRSLLLQSGERNILIDTGLGNKQSEKFRSHFEPHGPYELRSSVQSAGLDLEDITDVFLTHLHFDHVGGALIKDDSGAITPLFPNATFWSNEVHWNWAMKPNPREKASFLQENFVPIKKQGLLRNLDVQTEDLSFTENIKIRFVYGHTEAMMLPFIALASGRTLVYCADLIPSAAHVSLPYVMAYDIRPLNTMEEKNRLLQEAIENDYILFFEHDKTYDCATVKRNERGRIVIDQTLSLEEAMQL